MWINKNAYLYEKKLAADEIACLKMTIDGYKTQLNEVKDAQKSVKPTDAYTEPLWKRRNDNIDLQTVRSREMAALQQASMSSPFGGLQRKPLGQFFG